MFAVCVFFSITIIVDNDRNAITVWDCCCHGRLLSLPHWLWSDGFPLLLCSVSPINQRSTILVDETMTVPVFQQVRSTRSVCRSFDERLPTFHIAVRAAVISLIELHGTTVGYFDMLPHEVLPLCHISTIVVSYYVSVWYDQSLFLGWKLCCPLQHHRHHHRDLFIIFWVRDQAVAVIGTTELSVLIFTLVVLFDYTRSHRQVQCCHRAVWAMFLTLSFIICDSHNIILVTVELAGTRSRSIFQCSPASLFELIW